VSLRVAPDVTDARGTRDFRPWLTGLAFLAVVLSGCGAQQADVAAPAIEKEYTEGAAAVALTLDRDHIDTTGTFTLRVRAEVDEGADVAFPERLGSTEEFLLLGSRAASPQLNDAGKLVFEQVYELEPLAPGETVLPPLDVEVTPAGADETTTITTEPLPVVVDSVLNVDAEQAELRDISEPRSLPAPWWWYVGGGLAGLALFAFLYWRYARRKPARTETQAPPQPHEIALEALERLLAGDDLAQRRYKRFYGAVSDILRRYIEDRFGLRAPERTTEEFLEELRGSQTFEPDQQDLLRRFLQHCDLVKFAKLEPTSGEIDETVALCRRFIEETKPKPEPETPVLSEAPKKASLE